MTPPLSNSGAPSSTGETRRGPLRLVTIVCAAVLWSVAATLAATSFADRPSVASTHATASGGAGAATPGATTLTGAGSAPELAYLPRAVRAYERIHPGVTVSYTAAGAHGAAGRLGSGAVDFLATDTPPSPAAGRTAPAGAAVAVPVDLAAEAVAYNLRGARRGLRLSGSVLAAIFLGAVRYWDSPSIAALNPGLHLPHEAITVVHRFGGSGASELFSSYLAATSPAWRARMGAGAPSRWPVGVGVQGDRASATVIEQIPGAIGYLDLGDASQAHLALCRIRDAAGDYVAPTPASVASGAATRAHLAPPGFTGASGAVVAPYPIAAFGWVVPRQHQADRSTGAALAGLLEWLIGSGQRYAAESGFMPLPAALQRYALRTITEVDVQHGHRLASSP